MQTAPVYDCHDRLANRVLGVLQESRLSLLLYAASGLTSVVEETSTVTGGAGENMANVMGYVNGTFGESRGNCVCSDSLETALYRGHVLFLE